MARRSLLVVVISVLVVMLAAGCAPKVTRVASNTVTDLSGRWNDTDSQQVAQAIVTDCLSQPWLDEWKAANKMARPTVIVGNIVNKSQEHINTDTFIKDIERALINSGKVRFVSSRNERDEVRQERMDQNSGNTAEKTRASVGQETGANFIMKGSINSIVDQYNNEAVVWYQVNVELHNITTNEIAWVGQHKIKKLVERSQVRW